MELQSKKQKLWRNNPKKEANKKYEDKKETTLNAIN